ncbi:MAG: glycerate kinase [Clostridia bacterium]|nr:glycerate kinase [Clostridia bacterium]
MKFIVAPDSFKGSVSSAEACLAIERGIKRVLPDAEVVCKPIADGGEGTLEAIVPADKRTAITVSGPLFEKVTAYYGSLEDIAVVEMASAAGLTLVPEEKRDAGKTTTFGVGEIISHAIGRGYRRIMLTVGGSATNDGGCGMLAALGARFFDSLGNAFVPVGDTLGEIERIDISGICEGFFECEFLIATDVKNTLLGANGATYIYARQKGADEEKLDRLERGMTGYAELLNTLSGKRVSELEGCGAGGGISAPLLAFADARVRSGIDTVLDAVGFLGELSDTDAVITGEGRLDLQSLCGKAISGVAKRAAEKNIPLYCFVGCVGDNAEEIKKMGISEIYEVRSLADSAEDSIKNADRYLEIMAENFAVRYLS